MREMSSAMTISASFMSHLTSTSTGDESITKMLRKKQLTLYFMGWGIIFLFVHCGAPAPLVAKWRWRGKQEARCFETLFRNTRGNTSIRSIPCSLCNGLLVSKVTTLQFCCWRRSCHGSERLVTHSTKALWHNVHEISAHGQRWAQQAAPRK